MIPGSLENPAPLTSGEPPIAQGMIRLYRVEPDVRRAVPEWLETAVKDSGSRAAEGRWFTRDRAALLWYREDQGQDAKPRLACVDVPAAEIEAMRVSNQPSIARWSRDPESEFFVPASVAARRVVLGPASLLTVQRRTPSMMTPVDRAARVAAVLERANDCGGAVFERAEKAKAAVLAR